MVQQSDRRVRKYRLEHNMKNNNIHNINLGPKLGIAIGTISILTLAITAVLSINITDIALTERITEQLISESTIRGEAVKTVLENKIQQTELLGTELNIQNLMIELNNLTENHLEPTIILDQKRIDFLNEINEFQKKTDNPIRFKELQIAGKNGNLFFSLNGLNQTNDFIVKPGFGGGIIDSSIEFVTNEQQERSIVATVPIFEEKNFEKPLGVVITSTSFLDLEQILLNRYGLGESGEVYIVNNEKLMISESRHIENAAFNQTVATLPVQKCFEDGLNFNGVYYDYRGEQVYGFSHCDKDFGFVLLTEVNEIEVLTPLIELQEKIFLLGIILTPGVGILSFMISRTISRPLVKLKNVAKNIANGNFNIRMNLKSGDEIGQLAQTFDMMTEKLQNSIIKISEQDHVIREQQDLILQFYDQNEKYVVGIIDLVNSTKITSYLSNIQTSQFYSVFLNFMARIVRSYDGVIVKNVGDSLLYYFPNTNSGQKKEFENVIECCLSMIESHGKINSEMDEIGLPSISYRVSAVYGSVSIAKLATSYVDDIFGNTVNICQKMNALAEPNGLIIDESIYQKLMGLDKYKFQHVTNYLLTESHKIGIFSVHRKP